MLKRLDAELERWLNPRMDIDIFTPRALLLWSLIPKDARNQILKNVFCTQCRTAVEIVDYEGTEKKGDVILTGQCKACGNKVVRVVETSEGVPNN